MPCALSPPIFYPMECLHFPFVFTLLSNMVVISLYVTFEALRTYAYLFFGPRFAFCFTSRITPYADECTNRHIVLLGQNTGHEIRKNHRKLYHTEKYLLRFQSRLTTEVMISNSSSHPKISSTMAFVRVFCWLFDGWLHQKSCAFWSVNIGFRP